MYSPRIAPIQPWCAQPEYFLHLPLQMLFIAYFYFLPSLVLTLAKGSLLLQRLELDLGLSSPLSNLESSNGGFNMLKPLPINALFNPSGLFPRQQRTCLDPTAR